MYVSLALSLTSLMKLMRTPVFVLFIVLYMKDYYRKVKESERVKEREIGMKE
jgi:hypothetical protein